MRRDGVDKAELRHWFSVARAVIEINRTEPGSAEAVH
jgi:hypothetical protein